jgi:hypothetical protein
MHIGLYIKQPLFLLGFNETWFFPRQRFEKYTSFLNSVQLESGYSMQMERQTDGHDEANSRFSQFCEYAYKLS